VRQTKKSGDKDAFKKFDRRSSHVAGAHQPCLSRFRDYIKMAQKDGLIEQKVQKDGWTEQKAQKDG
jgi:hypothetical protein